jgi:hypothetical protein
LHIIFNIPSAQRKPFVYATITCVVSFSCLLISFLSKVKSMLIVMYY